MSVSSIGQVRLPAQTIGRSAAQGGFVVSADSVARQSGGAGRTSSVASPAPLGAAMMLALQENATAETGDREARQHGQQLLAALAELQRALLSGGATDALERLSRLADVTRQSGDPALRSVIASIRLRARLEVARAGAAAGRLAQRDPLMS